MKLDRNWRLLDGGVEAMIDWVGCVDEIRGGGGNQTTMLSSHSKDKKRDEK